MSNNHNGGYYAIKGFIYQFDKTMIDVFTNPDQVINIEQVEDIDYQDFVIQVKHRESQNFSNSKIKTPVTQLLELFRLNNNQKFCLYCHFKDKPPSKWSLNLDELDRILGDKKEDYSIQLKKDFINNFYIQFSEDYESQLLELIQLIQDDLHLPNKDLAYIYHSIIRSKLLETSIKVKSLRKVSRHDLITLIESTEHTIFYKAYANYLSKDKYEKLLKKKYFTFRQANLENFERLFIIAWDNSNSIDIIKLAYKLHERYFKANKSPHPYLCITNINNNDLVNLKRDLMDQNFIFFDGTHFDGDNFRLEKIIQRDGSNTSLRIKIVNYEYLGEVVDAVGFHEVFQFYFDEPIQINSTNQVLHII